jgi:hypothetical protein
MDEIEVGSHLKLTTQPHKKYKNTRNKFIDVKAHYKGF